MALKLNPTVSVQAKGAERPDLAHRVWRFYYRYYRAVRNFFRDRMERLNLWHFKLRGGDYLSWYARRLDRFANAQTIKDERVFEHLEDKGEGDLELLKRFGLKPHHHLHEIGLGQGRSARWFVDYLEPGHYCGNDPSDGRLEHARQMFEHFGLDDKMPFLIANTDNSMNWLDGRTFDFIFCNAVFTHMPHQDIEDLFSNLHHLMHNDTVFLFTYSEAPDQTDYRDGVKDWYHNMSFYGPLASRYNMKTENVTDEMRTLTGVALVYDRTRLIKVTRHPSGKADL